jgi:UDP-3-O-acyl N-acetylglucosamine deacetylase
VRKLCYRHQRTIARPAEVVGVGFLTGNTVRLRFQPAEAGTGIVFQRTDLADALPLPAKVDQVTGTNRRTTLGRPPGEVSMVEHVLAALAGQCIDNCIVQLSAPEPPSLDGSAQRFVDILRQAGAELQPARRAIWTVDAPIRLAQQGATLSLYPGEDELKISYLLDYGHGSPIGRQMHTEVITPERFASFLAASRTFILETEAEEFRRQGLGKRTTAADLLVFGRRGPIQNRLRYADEPSRHKILDLVGDLALFGHDLRGHVVAYRSGHPLNIQLARLLSEEVEASSLAAKLIA